MSKDHITRFSARKFRKRQPVGNWRPFDHTLVVNRRTGQEVAMWGPRRWRSSSTELVARAAVCLYEVVSRHNGTYAGEGGVPDLVACMEDLLIDMQTYFSRHERKIWVANGKQTRWRDRYKLPEVMSAHKKRMRGRKLPKRFEDELEEAP